MTDQLGESLYLIKQQRREPPVMTDEPRVRFVEKRRVVRTTKLFQTVEHAGWDHSRIVVRSSSASTREANGQRALNGIAGPVPKTAAGLKTVLRRMRPEETARVEEIDEAIDALHKQIAEWRKERVSTVTEAWNKARCALERS